MKQSNIRVLVILFWMGVVTWWMISRPEPLPANTVVAGVNQDDTPLYWFKGNTHTHAAIELNGWSHGNAGPDEVIRWYHDHGYHFVAITDHNRWNQGSLSIDEPTGREDFVVLSGMEITSDHHYPGVNQENKRKVHSTALGVNQEINWLFEDSAVSSIIQQHATRVASAGGLAILNHPNYRFQVQAKDIIAAPEIGFIEIFNAHPRANQEGHAGYRIPTEDLWDEVLGNGQRVWGVAADDAHDFGLYGTLMRRFGAAPPGGAWIMVRAPKLSQDNILEAMKAGDFYASTGVHLSEVNLLGDALHVAVNEELTDFETHSRWVEASALLVPSDDSHLVIEFIGQHGKLLHWTHDQYEASFHIPAGEPYVRTRVTLLRKIFSLTGKDRAKAFYAWTQPYFPNPPSAQ